MCVSSLRGLPLRHCALATQLRKMERRSREKQLASPNQIWPARDLNCRPPAHETNSFVTIVNIALKELI